VAGFLQSNLCFRLTYRNDPAAFVRDCFEWGPGEGPTSYQTELLEALPQHHRLCVRGPHGLGKSALAAWVVLWFSLTRDGAADWKIPTTASAWRQLDHFLWPEIHKWARRLRWDRLGREPLNERTELLQLNLRLSTGEAFAAASDRPELIEGAHADQLLYIFDEAKAIIPETFDAAEGAFSGAGSDTTAEAYALALSTPGEPNGRFYEIQSRRAGYEDWHVRAVTLDECIAAGRVSRDWVAQRALQWGVESAVYQNRVAGEFASSDSDGVIPLSWVEAANRRWQDWQDAGGQGMLTHLGVDVARSGEDKSVLALRSGDIIMSLRRYAKEDTMQVTGRVMAALGSRALPPPPSLTKSPPLPVIVVDVIGIGAGVVDRLREMEMRLPVIAFNAGEGSKLRDRSGELGFVNCRSAAWWNLRELLDPANGRAVALPPDDLLTGDLTAPRWRHTSGGAVQVESKDEIRKRLKRSTDDGDAVVQAFWVTGGELTAPASRSPRIVRLGGMPRR
jgi:hypothetical protein